MRAYERLIRYTGFEAASDENNPNCPSSPEQMDFALALVEEMKTLGMADANVDENGYVFGTIPSSIADYTGDVLGFIAHMDTVDVVPFKNVKTRLVENYDGSVLTLSPASDNEEAIVLDPAQFTELKKYIGDTLLVTDGHTLLGADDRAGIADILTMAEYLQAHPEIEHGPIKVGFTPDEEIGRGADLFDVQRFGADFAYTVDGGGFGEIEYETFNAASAKIVVRGKSIHPGSAKNKMIHAARIVMELDGLLPAQMRPEYTSGREGFFHLTDMSGSEEVASSSYILRDHDSDLLEKKKQIITRAVEYLREKYDTPIELTIKDSYRNMEEMIRPHWHLIEIASEEIAKLGAAVESLPVRGGTDGCRLSFMGLPCPNLGTGGHNGHGRLEYAVVEEMDKTVELLLALAQRYAKRK